MRLMLSWLLVVSIIVFGPVAAADITITQVTNNSHEDTLPEVKGDYLVWQGYVDGDWEVFLYNAATGETTQITDNGYDDFSPQTDGNYIAWQGFYEGEWDIFLWNGNEIQLISDASAEDVSPQIADGFVVWTSVPFGEDFIGPGKIILYDADNATLTDLSEQVDPGNSLDDRSPRINDEIVVWRQADGNGNTTSYVYELENGGMREVPEGFVWNESPQRDGNLRVLSRHDGHDREILVYNSDSRIYHQITDNGLQDRYPSIDRHPSIDGSYVAWMGVDGEASEIYIAFYEDEDEDTGTGSATVDSGSSGVAINGGGSCFVATAAFGSYVDPHVQVIRDFRDEYLLTNMPGRWFVGMYNTYGPFWADLLNAHPRCKPFVRVALMPVVGMSYFTLKTSMATKLLTGFLLVGFIVTCLLRIHCRSVTRGAKKQIVNFS